MNHFEEILCEGQSNHPHVYHDNEQLYDKSTNQSNLISTSNEQMNSPFDRSPKASMFFFSLNSPRQNADNFQFNNHYGHSRKNSKDHIQPITRRLQFQEDQSYFCEEDELEQEDNTIKQEQACNYSSDQQPQKTKKIKKSKNSKGLKNLSIGVYQIVTEKGQTTYKEVANTLIQKLRKKTKEPDSQQSGYDNVKKVDKDQHNIKRRVYDALNVLISADLLRKQGKRVIYNTRVKRQKNNLKIRQQHSRIILDLEREKLVIEQKRKQLQNIRLKYERIKSLMNRNIKLGLNYSKVIKLPFIVMRSNIENMKTISIGSNDVEIEYDGNVLIMGDVDTIEQIEKPSHSHIQTNLVVSSHRSK